MKHLLIILGLFLSINLSFGQSNPEDKLGGWYELGINTKISKKLSVNTYTLLWLYEANDNFNFVLLKGGLSYQLNPKLKAVLTYGYADFDGSIDLSSPHTLENRISEQIIFKHHFVKLPIEHRLMVDHRFLRKPNKRSAVARLRYRIGTKLKINNTLSLLLKNELLLSPKLSNSPENRFYSGLGAAINKNYTITIGYVNRNTMNKENLHRLQAGLFIKTDFTKK
ncbi:DUF2490 domain-containing protein [Aestuariivivens insulae]|uniref:DUF2490 domain-containing protein n=1 Tax=Aestuariivivens insulae TaxID=1621988 RepID=UPI001F5713E1|nr:DUF2490 domain-containing protein [Aestuariivivens insulae]